ncbi:MAG: ADP-ribosylglycohydrolase family protein [Desulfobulbus sp.]|nr:ADP-ribosylglycohydrolase family protein [Desulfobulbus sp.]
MTTSAQAAVLVSLAADALSLGAHWFYDMAEIDRRFGRVEELLAPPPDSFHAGKERGECTHYGDQTLVLLESVAACKGFDLADFARRWQALFTTGYRGYVDKATSATLENLQRGLGPEKCGSTSADLGGAARIAPLVWWYRQDRDQLLEAVRVQTAMTHNNPAVLAGAAFIARTAWSVLAGAAPQAALEAALEEGVADIDLDVRLRSALESAGKDTRTVIGRFGQMCGIASALPGAVHLICSYADDPRTALIENVQAGGDSAARGLVAGLVLGARHGVDAVPGGWLTGMQRYDRLFELLEA